VGKTAEELRYDIERQRAEISRDLDALGDKVSPSRMVERRTEAVKGRFRGFKESVMGSADHITTGASDRMGSANQSAHGAMGSVAETAHGAMDTVGGMPGMAKQQAAGNPLVAGAIAFGVGLLAATVIPETRKEHQLARKVQPQLEQAATMAAETGRQVADDLKPVAQEHAGQLQETAKDAAANVSQTAKDSAATVQEEAKGQAQQVKPGS
jgi:gas vesicle protein